MNTTVTRVLLLASLSLPLTAQNTHVIPNGTAATEGNSSNLFPWGRQNNFIHIEFIYDSSHFTNASINGPIVISRLRWRADGAPAAWTGGTYGSVRIDMSTAAVNYSAPSTTFANNHGVDRVMVHNGPVTVSGGETTGVGTGPYCVDLALTTPFTYDPSSNGDLCIEVQFDQTTWGGGTSAFLDIQGTGAMATRIFNSTAWPSTTGSIGMNHGAVMEVSYAPAVGLTPGFMANVTKGASPLQVQFTDLSHSSAPLGVLLWSWDFDGDNVIDSTLRNPTFTYTTCGTWSVSLTVVDASGPATLTRNSYISTDEIKPAFTWAAIAPNTIQFTDTSTPPATAWAWDLDGDNVTDSTVQNPTRTYPRGCTVVNNVRLAVTRQCRGPVSTSRSVYVGDSLTTTFAGGSGSITTWGNMFDVQVLNPQGISICALSSIANAALGTPYRIDVYVTPGSYVGKEATPGPWRMIGVANGTATGITIPSVATMATSAYLPPGSYGMALYPYGTGLNNTNGNQTFNNADLSLTLGVYRTDLFGNGGILGLTMTGKIWNGTVHYTTQGNSGESGYGFFGAGCAGALGVPANTASARPRIGQTMTAAFSNLPQSAVFTLIGFSRTTSAFGALPLDLSAFGAPGCFGRVSPDSAVLVVGAGNAASFNLVIPNNAVYLGAQFFTQGLALDPAANALGAVASDAAAAVVGL